MGEELRGYSTRLLYVESAAKISQTDFELIHRYILKRLNPKTDHLIIQSIPLNKELDTLIKGLRP